MLAAAAKAPAAAAITADEVTALERLMAHARQDSRQSRWVADFLLAWCNSGSCAAFDLTSLRALDANIVADLTTVFGLIGRIHRHPDGLGYEAEFNAIVQAWRPELGD
jgi:hypothetical protein